MRPLIPFVVALGLAVSACHAEPTNGVELAAVTPHFAERFPDDHRILADGTWDAYTIEEKMEFGFRVYWESLEIEPDDEAEANHRERVRFRDKLLNDYDDVDFRTDLIEDIEEMYVEHELFMLTMAEHNLRMKEGGFLGVLKTAILMWFG